MLFRKKAAQNYKVIKAKVAAVTCDTELALNIGSSTGVAVGDKVKIIEKKDVLDSSRLVLLGVADICILNLEIVKVEEQFCIARVTDRVGGSTTLPVKISRLRKIIDATNVKKIGSLPIKIGQVAVVTCQ